MMVRVGGGWDTLDHFLQRHDPCQVRTVSRPASPATSMPATPAKTPRTVSAYSAVRANYRSPTPDTVGR